MNKLCKGLNAKYNEKGFKSRAIGNDYLLVTNPYADHPYKKKYFIKFYKNSLLVFTFTEVKKILSEHHTIGDLEYVIVKVGQIYKNDGLKLNIKNDYLVISSKIKINLFTTINSIYDKTYDKAAYCLSAFDAVLDILKSINRKSVSGK